MILIFLVFLLLAMTFEPITNCCSAQFLFPGWPDNDLCSECKEHAEPESEEDEA